MGTTNHGIQITTPVTYHHEVIAATYGRLLQKNLPVGIYEGGYLTRVNDSEITLSALSAVIGDGTYTAPVKTSVVATLNNAALDSGTISSATPYIVLRWAYSAAINNYMEVHAIASAGSALTNDLIVGKCVFAGSTLTGFDYTDRSNPKLLQYWLRPEVTGDSDMYVRIRGGRFQTPNGSVKIGDQKVGPFVAPAAPNSRIDLIYINSAGTPSVLQGTAALSPTTPDYGGRLVLAEVTVTNGDVALTASDIVDVRPFLAPAQLIPDESSLTVNASGYLSILSPLSGKTYDSGWFACSTGQAYVKTHNLGSTFLLTELYFAPSSGGSPDLSRITRVDLTEDNAILDNDIGAVIQDMSATQLTVATASNYVATRLSGGSQVKYTSGFFRVVALRLD